MSKNNLATLLISCSALLVSSIFVFLLADIITHGLAGLSWSFLIEAPKNAGRSGGIGAIIVSTFLILLLAIAIAAPLGLATAVLLTEFTPQNSTFSRFVEHSLDILASVPSIVFGLFGNAFFCIYLGLGFSILSGGLTLACMVLPILIRTATEGLRLPSLSCCSGHDAQCSLSTSAITHCHACSYCRFNARYWASWRRNSRIDFYQWLC